MVGAGTSTIGTVTYRFRLRAKTGTSLLVQLMFKGLHGGSSNIG